MSSIGQSSIDNFLSQSSNFIKQNRFSVLIGSTINLLAHTVNLPDKTIQFKDSNNYRTGMTIKTPYALDWSELTCTFYMTNSDANELTEFEYFYSWVENNGGTDGSIFDSSGNTYTVNFVDEYSRDITVLMYAENGDNLLGFTFTNAYPTSVSYSDLSYASTDSLMEVNVSFTFEEIISTTFPVKKRDNRYYIIDPSKSVSDEINVPGRTERQKQYDQISNETGIEADDLEGAGDFYNKYKDKSKLKKVVGKDVASALKNSKTSLPKGIKTKYLENLTNLF